MNIKKKTLGMKNWVVVGARLDESTMGYKIPEILRRNGYNVYKVNPKYESVDGEKIYNSVLDIEGEIDCVDMLVNPRISIRILDEIAEAGIKYVWFQPGTYDDRVLKRAEELEIEYIKDCVYAALKSKEM